MRNLITATLAATVILSLMGTEPAWAQRGVFISPYGGGPYYYGEYHSKKPRHGYSGFHPGPYRLYCDYDRIPVRRCNRKGRCRVVKWIIKPYCY